MVNAIDQQLGLAAVSVDTSFHNHNLIQLNIAGNLSPEPWEYHGPEPSLVTIMLRSSGDRQRDTRRMRRIHALLASYPGNDRFAFKVYET